MNDAERETLPAGPDAGSMSSPRLPAGTLFGRYRASRVIGEGAQGVVYDGEHLTLGYRVAIKVMHGDENEARRARFRREARLGATLRHRHVVQVLEAGELDDGSPYLVMEHVEGCSLGDLLGRPWRQHAAVVELGEQLLSALIALSERGILHRDIKPENVMLERAVDGHVSAKLLDFGISKATGLDLASRTLTHAGTVLGTPQYMAPEQVRGSDLDARTDLYAVAGVLYEALTGRPPHEGPTAAAVIASVASRPVRPVRELAPECPRELAEVIDRALRVEPNERWSHPQVMAEALRAVAQRLGFPRGADAWAGMIEDGRLTLGSSAVLLRGGAECAHSAMRPARRVRAIRWVAAGAAALGLAAVGLSREHAQAPPPSLASAADLSTMSTMSTPPDDEGSAGATEAIALFEEPSLDEIEASARGLFVRGEIAPAMELYRRAIDREPRRASAWRGLGLVAAASGRDEPARHALTRYLELAPSAPDRAQIEGELSRLR